MPFPSAGDLPDLGIETRSLAFQADSLSHSSVFLDFVLMGMLVNYIGFADFRTAFTEQQFSIFPFALIKNLYKK